MYSHLGMMETQLIVYFLQLRTNVRITNTLIFELWPLNPWVKAIKFQQFFFILQKVIPLLLSFMQISYAKSSSIKKHLIVINFPVILNNISSLLKCSSLLYGDKNIHVMKLNPYIDFHKYFVKYKGEFFRKIYFDSRIQP